MREACKAAMWCVVCDVWCSRATRSASDRPAHISYRLKPGPCRHRHGTAPVRGIVSIKHRGKQVGNEYKTPRHAGGRWVVSIKYKTPRCAGGFLYFSSYHYQAPYTTALTHAPSHLTERATHAHPLHPAALASVPSGKVLVRVRVGFCIFLRIASTEIPNCRNSP